MNLDIAVSIVQAAIYEDNHSFEDAVDIAVESADVDEDDLLKALAAIGLPEEDYSNPDFVLGAVLAQIEDLSLDDQLQVVTNVLGIVSEHFASYVADMRQEVAPID